MTIIDRLIWDAHKALKSKSKKGLEKAQKELLKEGFTLEHSYTLMKPKEPNYTHTVNINFLEERFKNVK